MRSSPMAPAARRRRIVASAKPNGAGTTIATRSGRASAAASIAPASAASIAIRPSTRTCLPAPEGRDRDGGVEVRPRGDHHGVDVRIGDELLPAGVRAGDRELRGRPCGGFRRSAHDPDDLHARQLPEPRDVPRAGDPSGPDQPDPDPLRHAVRSVTSHVIALRARGVRRRIPRQPRRERDRVPRCRAALIVPEEDVGVPPVREEGFQPRRPRVEVGGPVHRAAEAQVEEGTGHGQRGIGHLVRVGHDEDGGGGPQPLVGLVDLPRGVLGLEGEGDAGGPGRQQPVEAPVVAGLAGLDPEEGGSQPIAEGGQRCRQPRQRPGRDRVA